jgi:HTH-type transcriptional regulator, global nitrogen regulator NrpRI
VSKLSQRRLVSILQVLHGEEKPLGGSRIAQKLREVGLELSQRTVRYYLEKMDRQGLTQNLGKKGRKITARGKDEVRSAFVFDKVGFIAAKIDALTYQMSFSLRKSTGNIILNFSVLDRADLPRALPYLQAVFKAGLGMGRFVGIGVAGTRLGNLIIEPERIGIGTVCSVTINGVLLSEGIPTTSRFGGLLEMANGAPARFTQIINYDGSSIDPLEIFIKGGMTSVYETALTGNGKIGASFREVPSVAVPHVEKLKKKLEALGMNGILMIGKPGQPLLDVPVSEGRAGMIVAGGLNPLAAVQEAGIGTENMALGTIFEFDRLVPFWELDHFAGTLDQASSRN